MVRLIPGEYTAKDLVEITKDTRYRTALPTYLTSPTPLVEKGV